MARRRPGHILPFRIPFFRIFYSTTYTTIYLVCLIFLAITPASMIWQSVQQRALQYTIMIGGTYILTGLIAIFIYASRLFTNRIVLSGVGKPYIPVEDGEVGKKIRKMIVGQFERSAIIAWESRPRDLDGELLQAEKVGIVHVETGQTVRSSFTTGREIPVDPQFPPWGQVQHAGWSSPAHCKGNDMPNMQYAPVVAELPNLIEARAVSLAPPDPMDTAADGPTLADMTVVETLRRPETMGIREYLTQLSYLGLINPPEIGQSFLFQYERARFGALPLNDIEFKRLMSTFAELLSGMTGLNEAIIEQIRIQAGDRVSTVDTEASPTQRRMVSAREQPPRTPESSQPASPVTARIRPSRNPTPYLQQDAESSDSIGSVVRKTSNNNVGMAGEGPRSASPSLDSSSLASETGSVLRHSSSPDNG